MMEFDGPRMDVRGHHYPELNAGGFSRVDGTIEFYTRVRSLLKPNFVVLDFGAGRGVAHIEDPVDYRRSLLSLRSHCRVVGVDVDPKVLANPGLHEARVIQSGDPLPFPDQSFDLVLADHVLEHIDDPPLVAGEIDRVLRSGGWLCARTPNVYGYIAIASRLVPNVLHRHVLGWLQPARRAIDVFPTRYMLNSRRSIQRWFPRSRYVHCLYAFNPEPAYFGRSRVLWHAIQTINRLAPEACGAVLMIFLRKRLGDQGPGA